MRWGHGRISRPCSHVLLLFSKAKQHNTIGKDTTARAPAQYKVTAPSTWAAVLLVNIERAQRFGLVLLLLLGLWKQPQNGFATLVICKA